MTHPIEPKMPSLVAFGISVLKPGQGLDIDRLFIGPKTALKLHPDRFLEFATTVQAVADRYRAHLSQQELDL